MSKPAEWSRRELLKLAGAVPLWGCGGAAPRPRNVVLITGDDLGWKDLSSCGNPNLKTPHLDRLKRGGVSFRNAFDVTSTCSSSRATYATGQYPHTHGVTGLVHRDRSLSLHPRTPTLASTLRKAGLHTGIEGKWHLAFPRTPEIYGYDEVMTSWEAQLIVDSTKTAGFIERNAGRRFFLEVNYMNPHRNARDGFEPHPDHPVDPAALIIPQYVHLPDVPGARTELAVYYSQVERMDAMIGELVAALEANGLLDDTLVTFISDNGIPFPGNKLTLHDRGTGTPWLFHWPAALPAGVERDDLVSSVDLMPTLLEAAGAEPPTGLQGESLLPLLRDGRAAGGRDAVFSEMTSHTGTPFPMRSVRTARHRYIRNYSDEPVPLEPEGAAWVLEVLAAKPAGYRWGERRVPEELYDLERDPHEQVNLAGEPAHAGALEELRARLDAHMTATADAWLGRPFERTGG